MAPRALPCLQKLHVEESTYDLEDFAHGTEEEKLPVLRLGKLVFSLPNLTEVSGRSRLFLLEMPKKWRIWSKCSEECHCKSRGHTFDPYCCHRVWRRLA